MPPIRRLDPPATVPRLRKPLAPRLIAMAVLAIVYVAGFFVFSHRPNRPHSTTASAPTLIDIPVKVVKFRQNIPAPPPLVVHLDTPPVAILPPPQLHIRNH